MSERSLNEHENERTSDNENAAESVASERNVAENSVAKSVAPERNVAENSAAKSVAPGITPTEREKMLSGQWYDSSDEELASMRLKAHDICRHYNELSEIDEERWKLLAELCPDAGEGLFLQGPIQFDYGVNTHMGKRVYANFNFTCVDCADVFIGDDAFIGPNVSLLTPLHPFRWQERNQFMKPNGIPGDKEKALPIRIGKNCWIAGNVTICGGVTIGEGCVIGAGAVVTRDIPANSLAVGVPAKPIRQITEADSVE